MEWIWITLGVLFILAGIIGSFLPVVPGLPFSFAGLLCLQFTSNPPFSLQFLLIWAGIVFIVMTLENLIPAAGAKKYGGTQAGITGSIAGAIIGFIIFPPFGLIIGPILGAFIGEILAGKKSDLALKSATGAFIGFLAGTVLKVATALVMTYYFFVNI